ncbi:MAG: hypothetical protein K0S39_1804 [Paenibacillus sp.]|nr:hypothetical protein [Paenibacillus sp.]
MAQGVVDVYVSSDQNENTLVLITNCGGGLPNDLNAIRNGIEVTLKRGDTEKTIVVTHERGAECAFNYMEINENTAKTFGLRGGNRVALTYDPESRELKMQRLTKSRASGLLLPDPRKYRDSSIVIGYTLLCWLGIPEAAGTSVTFRKGSASKKLKVIIPENELDTDLRLSLTNLRKFGLVPGKALMLEYDQMTKTLNVLTAAADIASKTYKPSKPGKPANRTALGKPSKIAALGRSWSTANRGKTRAAKKSGNLVTAKSSAIVANGNNRGKLTRLVKGRKRV